MIPRCRCGHVQSTHRPTKATRKGYANRAQARRALLAAGLVARERPDHIHQPCQYMAKSTSPQFPPCRCRDWHPVADKETRPMATQPPVQSTDDPQAARQCGGWPRVGIPAHPSTRDQFGRNAANPDGLAGACKACNTKYRQQRAAAPKADPAVALVKRAQAKAAKAVDDTPATEDHDAAAAARADDWVREHRDTKGDHHGLTGPNSSATLHCPLCRQVADHAALDAQLAAAGGVASDNGQALLAQAAADAAKAKRDARNERQRAWRAARKAAAANS